MVRARKAGLAIAAIVCVAGTVAAQSGKAKQTTIDRAMVKEHITVTEKDLKWQPGPAAIPPGSQMAVLEGDPKVPDKLFTLRLKVPDGWQIPAHMHPADEHITVLQGSFDMGMGDKFDASKLTQYGPGSFMVMPAGHNHFAKARGETLIQLHAIGPWEIIYKNPADDPRKARTGRRGEPAQR